jgi:hypothetical protein
VKSGSIPQRAHEPGTSLYLFGMCARSAVSITPKTSAGGEARGAAGGAGILWFSVHGFACRLEEPV